MTNQSSLEAVSLIDVHLFKGLSEEDKQALVLMLTPSYLKKDEILFHCGDPGDTLYIVSEGKIELFVTDHLGEKITLVTHSHGELFGELALLDEGPRTAHAVAQTDCLLFAFHREQLLHFLRKRPDAALSLMRGIVSRLRQANQMIQMRVAKDFNQQIESKLTLLQKCAAHASTFAGSFSFFLINAGVFLLWAFINTGMFDSIPVFDPYPFSALSFFVSLEAMFLSIVVLFAQNVEAASARIKNDIEYDVNIRAERSVTHLHEKIDELRAEVLGRMSYLEKSVKRAA